MSSLVSAAPVDCLPGCVAFQSKQSGKFLRYVADAGDDAYKMLQMDGEDAINPYTRFQVQRSALHEGLVHIRCCYNHKYWVARRSGDGWWLAADADEPEEDLSKPSCTLINLVPGTDDAPNTKSDDAPNNDNSDDAPNDNSVMISSYESFVCRFRHAQLGRMGTTATGTRVGLAGDGDQQPHDEHDSLQLDAVTVLNLPAKLLPQHVVFKSVANGRYLSARVIDRLNYLQFASDDIGDPTVQNQVVHRSDGRTIRVRSTHFGLFWRRSPNWIWADASADTVDARFEALQVADFFAIRNMGNSRFCVSLTADRKNDCLNAASDTIAAPARIEVEEAVLSREIYNVRYRLGEARIYGNTVLTLFTESAINTTESKRTKTIKVSYSVTQTSTWDSSLELKLGVTTKFRAGAPFVADGGIEITSEFTTSHSWGETIEKTLTKEVSYDLAIPPKSKSMVRVIASQASCDVPFSYNQRDIMTDGRIFDRVMHDGIYTGVNAFDIQTEFKDESL